MTVSQPTTQPAFPLGTRCTRCHRHLVRGAAARRGLSGRWRHDSCQEVAEPSAEAFDELAGALMRSHPWPRLLALESQLDDASVELAQLEARAPAIPEQRAASAPSRADVLRERVSQLRAGIADERAWKAARLAAEWADGQ